MQPPLARSRLIVGLLLGLAACAAAYYPGLHGDFIFDDGPNIIQNSRLQVDTVTLDGLRQAAFSADSGMLKRPISMLSFWANFYTTGLDPFYFKLTNLFIHLLNGLGIFWLTRLLLDAPRLRGIANLTARNRGWLALAVTTIWLVHPLNVTSVLYVVQRMTSLSATFAILALISYVLGRERLTRGAPGFFLIFLGLAGFGSLAVLSKENGALLALYAGVIEVTLFGFAALERATVKKLKAFFLVTVVAPGIAALVFLATQADRLGIQYQGRDFTPLERLMTQARALWLYLRWTVVPRPADLGLFHDDIAVSRGLLQPATTLLAIAGIFIVCYAAIRFRKQAPLFAFAAFWYLAGHALESSVIGLELMHEHRNYLPIYGPLLAFVYLMVCVPTRLGNTARLALPLVFTIGLVAVTAGRSLDWRDLHSLRMALVRHHPDSARSNYEAGVALGEIALKNPALAPTYYEQISAYLQRSASLDATAVNPLFSLILLNATNGRPVDESSIDHLKDRLSKAPLNFTVVEAFRSVVDWMNKGTVVLRRDMVLGLFAAALGNQTADRRTRATLFAILSAYQHNIAGDLQESISLAIAAVEEDPAEPAHHLSLAALAVKLGNFELAASELEAVTRNDPLGRFTLKVRELAEYIGANRPKNEPL